MALILAVAVTGSLLTMRGARAVSLPAGGTRIATVYLPMLVVQWGLALYVCRIGRRRNALASLLGVRWTSLRRALVDVALAAVGWLLVSACEIAWANSSGAASSSSVAILPHTSAERLVWVAVATSVGFCEEIVYRGYLQTQLTSFTCRATLGIVLQAVLFGCAHAEQGWGPVLRLSLYGVMFGVLAWWRRSLLPGIVCHVGIDLASGLLRG